MLPFTDVLFTKFSTMIYDNLGIHFGPAKKDMLKAKLDKLLRLNSLDSYNHYYEALQQRGNDRLWAEFVDEITVHQSGFFRENHHFEFIRTQLRLILEKNPRIMQNKEIKIWSAGCSTGEEAYTLAMVLKEWLPAEIAVRILATDVSSKTLAAAQNGLFPSAIKKSMDPYYLMEYFQANGDNYEVKPELKELITFRLFNLMEPFPFTNPFDVIFCRNVMIYFDQAVQEQLISKFYDFLTVGGLLFIGHSESLIGKQYRFRYLEPTIYIKEK